MKKLLVILGPTSTGKTDFGLKIAGKFNGEIVACDSRQVYKGLDIGTGKLPARFEEIEKGKGFWKIDHKKIWLYDVANPNTQYTVYDYVNDATKVVDDISKRKKLPIILAGTGLYLKALLEGFPNLSVPPNLNLRKKLQKLSLGNLQNRLKKINQKKWENMNNSDRGNQRRLIRALELEAGKTRGKKSLPRLSTGFSIFKIGLIFPRQTLYQRIDARLVKRIRMGMLKEAEDLHGEGLSYDRMKQLGLEYRFLAQYLEGTIKNRKQLISILRQKIKNYVRRQITWFKREQNVLWVDMSEIRQVKKVEREIKSWYYHGNDEAN